MGATIRDASMAPGAASRKLSYSAVWLQAAAIGSLLTAMYAGVVADLVTSWSEEPGASHGFLVPVPALWIAWVRRPLTLAQPVAPDARGLWLTALGCVAYMVGKLGAEFFVTRLSLLIVITGLIWTYWGFARLRTLIFPLILLVTMIPVPALLYNWLAVPLQLFASQAATILAQILGVTVHREGNVIFLADISLGVAEACSGLHSLSALMVGSLLLGFLYCTKASLRAVIFFASIPIAIAVNVLRVTGTALLADYRPQLAMGFYHSFSSWLIFLIGFGLVVGFAKGLHRIFET